MEPRKAELNKTSEDKDEKKRRFQIVKLEERIAPRGPCTSDHSHACGQGRG